MKPLLRHVLASEGNVIVVLPGNEQALIMWFDLGKELHDRGIRATGNRPDLAWVTSSTIWWLIGAESFNGDRYMGLRDTETLVHPDVYQDKEISMHLARERVRSVRTWT